MQKAQAPRPSAPRVTCDVRLHEEQVRRQPVVGASFVVGVTAFALLQLFLKATWSRWFGWQKVNEAGFLNSGRSVLLTIAVLFAAAVGLGVVVHRVQRRWAPAATAMALGVAAAMCAVLVAMGPGNIWPIVLVIGGVVTAIPVILGVWAGAALHGVVASRHEA